MRSRFTQQTVAETMMAKFGVTRNKETHMVVGLRLDDFDPTESDVDKTVPVFSWTFDVACQPDSSGYP